MKLYEWRIFVGPRYVPLSHTYTSAWWTLNTDQTTLTATLADGATTATIATITTANWPAPAGAWIGPNGNGQAWEYIEYTGRTTTSLTGLQRESSTTREHNGVHSSGAAVCAWWSITTDNGALRLSEQIDAALTAIIWQADVSGLRAPQPALRDGHAVIIQTRDNENTTWTTLLRGFVKNVQIRDDASRRAEWSFSIVSPAAAIQDHRAPGLRVGDFSIAKSATTTTSTVLVDPRRESQSGDFTAAAPDLTGKSAVDEDADTLWIAETVVGAPETASNAPSGYSSFASKLRINRWPGETEKSRYIEWRFPAGSFGDATLCSATNNQNGENQSVVQFNDISTTAGQRVILCEDEDTFNRLNPLAADADLREIGSAFFDGLDLASDAIAIYDAALNGWSETVAWGDIDNQPHWENFGEGDDDGGNLMTGTNPCTAPLPGQVIRFLYTSGASETSDHFYTDYLEYAGYIIGQGTAPYIALKLPEIGLALDADITSSVPAAASRLYIADLSGAASTIGLTATGTIQIGLEQITYTDRTVDSVLVSARGANGTTAAAHLAGDAVQVVYSGEAMAAPLLDRLEWERAQTPAPTQFVVYATNQADPRTPADASWTDDWTALATVTGHSALTYSLSLGPARWRHILIKFERMGANPARPRLNELRLVLSPDGYSGAVAMDAAGADDVIEAILTGASYNGAGLTKTGGQTVDGVTTDNQENAWRVILSMAQYANALIDVKRDATIEIDQNPYSAGTLTSAITWTDATAATIETLQQPQTLIAQIRQPWRTPDASESGEARYPTTPNAAGEIVTLEEILFADGTTAQAAAMRAYIMQRYPTTWAIQCAEDQPTYRPGAICRIQWQIDSTMQQVDRLVIVTAADHEIANGIWTTVLRCRQVDRASVA